MATAFEKISKVLAASLNISAEELHRSFSRATQADVPAVCTLMHLGFGEVANLRDDVVAWRYFNFSKHGSDLFVLRYKGEIIAAVGTEPINVKIGDQVCSGIRAGDIVVRPDYLKSGIGAWMNLYLQNEFSITMAMGSNKNSNTMVRRLFKAMNCRHHLKILFSTKAYFEAKGFSALAARTLSFISILPLNIIRRVAAKRLEDIYKISVATNTVNLAEFFADPDYQARAQTIVLRSADYCHWRYDLNPISVFFTFEMRQANRLLGYAIVKQPHCATGGDWQLMDWDFLASSRSDKLYRELFSAVVGWVAATSAESLSVMASDQLSITSLVGSGFSYRAVEDGFFLQAKPGVNAAVMNENQWFLSFCDTDEAL